MVIAVAFLMHLDKHNQIALTHLAEIRILRLGVPGRSSLTYVSFTKIFYFGVDSEYTILKLRFVTKNVIIVSTTEAMTPTSKFKLNAIDGACIHTKYASRFGAKAHYIVISLCLIF